MLDMSGDFPRIVVGGDIYTSNVIRIPLFQWTHVAGTFDGTTLALYVNGIPAGSQTLATPHPIPTNANTLRIGADSLGGSLVNGMIDEPRIFNRALSPSEIADLVWASSNCQ
jgi:hypothetical protein